MSATVSTETPAFFRRPEARWIVSPVPDAGAIALLAAALQIPEEVANLLIIRKHNDPDEAKRFLRPRRDQLHDAGLMKGADRAVDRLVTAVTNGERVLIHGDYDVDGICSATILTRVLREFGADPIPFIPHRIRDGYDLSDAGVREAHRVGATLVVTCDCGTSAIEPIAQLCQDGIDVIVTDHHLPSKELPECLAVLNPQQSDCDYPDKDLAAVAVAFKLALALADRLQRSDNFIWRMLDLVALATVADVARLRGENRILVRYGLRMLAETDNLGLRAMIRAAGLEGKPITAGRVGFIIGPRLNAAGRMDRALRGVELLMTADEHEANVIARELEELNGLRQEAERVTLAEAREMVAMLDPDETFGIVVAREGWHPGVIGIVASRLVEEFGRPAIVIALEGESGKGSGRGIPRGEPPFDLHGALGRTAHLLTRFGGHKAAAGITIESAKVAEFTQAFNDVARSMLCADDLIPEVRIDVEVPVERVGDHLEKMLRHFEPFGMGNPAPTLFSRSVELASRPRLIGRDGIKLRLSTGSGEIDAVGWGMAKRIDEFDGLTHVDVAFRLEREEFRGVSRLQARIVDIKPPAADSR
ncbi:MAG: single-stranded-DNA-specific exonuclease RecJ [Gemmatimonadaceae bacterium]